VKQTVLVTGANGFVGRHLLNLLTSEGTHVVAWQRASHPNELEETKNSQGRNAATTLWQSIDVLDRKAVFESIRTIRPSAIYHCAGAAHVGNSWNQPLNTLRVNTIGTHHLLEAIRLTQLDTRLLIPGSAMVYKQSSDAINETHAIGPSNPYGLSKLAQELLGTRAAKYNGATVLITRSFNHLGPGQDPSYVASGFAEQIARIETCDTKPVILTGNLDARRDLTDVRDTVRAYRLIMESGQSGRIYNVCSGRTYVIRDVLERLLLQTQAEIRVESDLERWRPQDNPLLLGDPKRLKDELGWTPSISLNHTLNDLLNYWRKRIQSENVQ
jgi:GDP-4-dehydro-6-deoxy-D-mannose reductase